MPDDTIFAAFIAETRPPRPVGAQERLSEMGVDVPVLRQRLFEWVRGYGDDDMAWREALLESTDTTRKLSDIHADDTRGPDLLDIEQDIVALATVIAARAVSPPLSIGLFGDRITGSNSRVR